MLMDQQQLVLLSKRLVQLLVVLKKVLHQMRGRALPSQTHAKFRELCYLVPTIKLCSDILTLFRLATPCISNTK